MKLLLITAGLLAASHLGTANPVSSDDASYVYIHSGGADCDSTYRYEYNLTSSSKPTIVKFSIDLVARKDPEIPNALLFWFKDYAISEYSNAGPEPSNEVSQYPVRVVYRANGVIEKIEYDDRETDASYHLKNGILRTLQLPWTNIQTAAREDGEKEFSAQLPRSKGSCQAQTKVEVRSAVDFCVAITRKLGDCTGGPKGIPYEKFQESTKEWHYHFSPEAKNFHHAKINIENFISAEETISIKSGFAYEGCNKFEGADWNTSELKEIIREFVIPKRKE